jgi:hypothetical protein
MKDVASNITFTYGSVCLSKFSPTNRPLTQRWIVKKNTKSNTIEIYALTQCVIVSGTGDNKICVQEGC